MVQNFKLPFWYVGTSTVIYRYKSILLPLAHIKGKSYKAIKSFASACVCLLVNKRLLSS